MTPEHQFPLSPRMEAAIAEIQRLISSHYPTTTYTVYEWDDPEGIFVDAIVDTEDLEAVTDLFRDRLLDWQVEDLLPLFVIPERTPEKHAALLAREAAEREASLVG
jgi:hypothetical protein